MHHIQLRENNVDAGLLHIAPGRLTRSIRAQPSLVSISSSFDANRAEVIAYIERTYRDTYDARIRVDYPNLVSVRDADGQIFAAAGFRYARRSPLFLEHYTRLPIETILGIPRAEIAEIGNLASGGGGASVYLITARASSLLTLGISRAVITGTRSIERRLSLLGMNPRRVCPADPLCVAGAGDDWGSYYETQPYVLAGNVSVAFEGLRRLFGTEFFQPRPRLYPQLSFEAEAA